MADFAAARRCYPDVQPWTLRAFLALYLAAKRRKLRRFLDRARIATGGAHAPVVPTPPGYAAAAVDAGSGRR
jgi:hypothetical protein